MKRWLPTALLALLPLACGTENATLERRLTLWLIPLEPHVHSSPEEAEKLVHDLQNRYVREEPNQPTAGSRSAPTPIPAFKRNRVTVLNLLSGYASLVTPDPEFGVPMLDLIRGQQRTLGAVQEFADAAGIDVDVLFASWKRVRQELKGLANVTHDSSPRLAAAPDVAMVGSTWVPFLVDRRLVLEPTTDQQGGLQWRSAGDMRDASLRFTTDVRLLFYWKCLPDDSRCERKFALDSTTWGTLLQSLAHHQSANIGIPQPPMVMPIGNTANLLWDLLLLVEWDKTPLFHSGVWGPWIELDNDEVLAVPRMLATQSMQTLSGNNEGEPVEARVRLVEYPETLHELASQEFVYGRYRAIIEPAHFLIRWHQRFAERFPDRDFSEQAAVAELPGKTYRGGSDLLVTTFRSRLRDEAFALARFLAQENVSFPQHLAELGHLPAQREDVGVDSITRRSGLAPEVSETLAQAVKGATDYPATPSWIDLDSAAVLEALQPIWRRVADGDPTALRDSAQHAQAVVNAATNRLSGLEAAAQRVWLSLLLLTVAIAATIIASLRYALRNAHKARAAEERRNQALRRERDARTREEEERRRMYAALALSLMKVHTLLRVYGRACRSFAYEFPSAGSTLNHHLDRYGTSVILFNEWYLRPVVSHAARELLHAGTTTWLSNVVVLALEAARLEYEIEFRRSAPPVELECTGGLADRLIPCPGILTMALQEWMFNTLKRCPANGGVPFVSLALVSDGDGERLVVSTPFGLTPQQRESLNAEPASLDELHTLLASPVRSAGWGLLLIRDILFYALNVRVNATVTEGATKLTLTFPQSGSQSLSGQLSFSEARG